jgi:hypothetical protein
VEQNLRDWLEGQCVPWTIRIRPSGLSSYPEFVWSALGWSPPASKKTVILDCLTESSFHLELTSQSYSKGTMITRPKASSNLIGGWNHVWYKSGGGTDFMTIVNTSIISLCIFLWKYPLVLGDSMRSDKKYLPYIIGYGKQRIQLSPNMKSVNGASK